MDAMPRRSVPLCLALFSLLLSAGASTTASAAHRTTVRGACGHHTPARPCPNLLLDKSSSGTRAISPAAGLPGAGGCPNSALAPAAGNRALISASLLCLINGQRGAAGLRPLRANARLAGAAQRHSDDMVRSRRFDHTGSAGDTMPARIAASGYRPGGGAFSLGENIAWLAVGHSTPAAMVADWMASPDHRANILDPSFRDSGIGLTPAPPSRFTGSGRGTTVTQDFGSR
jgi:uncharacterized protein YkwD